MSPSTIWPVAGSSAHLSREEQQLAGADRLASTGPIAFGRAVGLSDGLLHQAALTTLLDRRQRVQTRIRLTPPLIIARTV